jgi:hypothetical protein
MKIRHPLLLKKLFRILIPPDPHGIDLPLRPLVQIHRSDEREMHAHVAMDGGAIEAEEDAVGGGCPCGAGVGAVEAYGVLFWRVNS